MPQPIQGPTLAEVGQNVARREKEIRSRGKISGRGAAELKKLEAVARQAGASKKDLSRQRAIAKEMNQIRNLPRGQRSTAVIRRYNSLFRESGRIAKKARAAASKKQATAVKKAAKKKAAKKAVKKAVKKTARPAKKAAKKVAKKAAPVKKTAKKRR